MINSDCDDLAGLRYCGLSGHGKCADTSKDIYSFD